MKHARALVLLGSVLVLSTAACDGGGGSTKARTSSTSTSPDRPAVDGALAIGELAPVSGPVSTIASSFTVPVQLAVDEMNLAGGVNHKPVTVTVADDASAVPTARAALRTLIDTHHVDAVIGPSSSEVAAAIMPDLPRDHVVVCSGSNSAGALSDIDAGGFYFRTAPPDRLQALALARLVATAGRKRPAVIAATDSYGVSMGRAVVAALHRAGTAPKLVPQASGADPTAVVARALRGNPDAMVLVGFPDGMAPVLRALAATNHGPTQFPVYASDGLQTADLGALVDPANPAVVAALSGTTPAGAPAGIDHPFTGRMLAAGVEPFFSASAYDCTILVGLAAVAAHSDAADAIRTHLAPNLRGRVDCKSFVECSQLLRAGRRIHYRGAFSTYDGWRGTEPGTGVYDVWTMGLDAHPVLAPPERQLAVP